ncbi:MFS transporter [Roseomonas sp. OT10]|uniref:MFS transporter n=1 Tax=Roseomonas cutis TaxID=2897332 RepID=UPI001E2A2623|nr:MFS transporter [Roseomonas sp. OT10]UFN49985.1 MFS transporter [Roseomonas sp. OT10]
MTARLAAGRIAGRIAGLGIGQTIAFACSFYLPAVLAAPMARELDLASGDVYAAFSGGLLVTALLGPWAGRLVDRRGGRGVLAASSLALAAGLALLALAQGPVLLVGAWMVLGLGMALGFYETAFAALAALHGTEARGAIAGVTLIAGFASTLGWPLTTLMAAEWGWRGACLGWAGLNLLVSLPAHLLALPTGAGGRSPTAVAAVPPGAPPPRAAMILLAVAFAAIAFNGSAIGTHLPGLLAAAGAGPGEALLAASLLGPAQVAGRLAELTLLRRLSPLATGCAAILLHPLGAALLAGFGAAAGFALLHGAGNGLLTVTRGTLPLALFGPAGYGARQGWLAAPARLVQALAPLLFGLALESAGAGALWLSTAVALLATAALLALRLRRASGNDGPPAAAGNDVPPAAAGNEAPPAASG